MDLSGRAAAGIDYNPYRFYEPSAWYTTHTCRYSLAGFATGASVSRLSGCPSGLGVSYSMTKGGVPDQWLTWSSPPYVEDSTPDVLYTSDTFSTFTLDKPAKVVGFEIEPNRWDTYEVLVGYYNGAGDLVALVSEQIDGEAGARLIAIQRPRADIKEVTVVVPEDANGFAVAQIRAGTEWMPVPLVIFVEGVTSTESCAKPNEDVLNLFGFIKDEVLPDAIFRVFSYRSAGSRYMDCETVGYTWPPDGLDSTRDWSAWEGAEFGWKEWPNYVKGATCGSIDGDGGHSARFRQWYKQEAAIYEDVYILSHSMGGVVVVNAVATWPGGPPANLRAVVTLDSPLQGREWADLHGLLPGCAVGDDAYTDLDPSTSTVIPVINPPASVLWRNLVTAIGNNQDFAVPASDSHMPGAWLNFRIDRGCRDIGDHHCVFRFDEPRSAIRESLLKPYGAGYRLAPSLAYCDGLPANVIGSSKGDQLDNLLVGGPGDDVIVALGGEDWVFGGDGNDRVCGGAGSDIIDGGAGQDRLFGEGSSDNLVGGPNNDMLAGGPGGDTLVGMGGDDILAGGPDNDTLDGGPGVDTCDISGLWELLNSSGC